MSPYWGNYPNAQWDRESEEEQSFVRALAKAVIPGGMLIVTFDFNNHGAWKRQNKCAYMRSHEDVVERIIKPSGLIVVGDIDYKTKHDVDCHPPASTGIIVLTK